jgi:hypothetical protein
LIYKTNKERIDHHLSHASDIVNSQASQVKDLAGQHTANATEALKGYASGYTAKAQGMISNARARSTSPNVPTKAAPNTTLKSDRAAPPAYSSSDFPNAPKQEPLAGRQATAI